MSAAARCDECGTFDVLSELPNPRRFAEVLPKNWLRVLCFDNEGREKQGSDYANAYKVDGQFCSFACASKFLAKEGTARG